MVSYQWEQLSGAVTVTLSDSSAVQPTFISPNVDAAGLALTFQLTMTDDGGLAASDEVAVTIADNGMTDFPADVLPIMTDAGMPIGLAGVSGGAVTRFGSSQQPQNPSYQGAPIDLHFGLLNIAAKSVEPGGSVTITILFSEPAGVGASWYKFNTSTETWSDYSLVTDANGRIGAVFNDTRDQVILTLVDGGIGDDDGAVNGVIVDPSGLGALMPADSAPASDPNGYGGQASNDFGVFGRMFYLNDDRRHSILNPNVVGLGSENLRTI